VRRFLPKRNAADKDRPNFEDNAMLWEKNDMRMRRSGQSRAIALAACVVILGWAVTALALDEAAPAFVYPVERVYPLTAINADGGPSAEDWAKAFPGEQFFSKGIIEKEGTRTVYRMVEGKDRLYVRVECASRGTGEDKESVEFYVTQSGKPDFPCVAVTVKEDGTGIIGLARRAHTWWIRPQVFPLDESVIPREVAATENGWTLEFSLPFDELDIPREGFRFNVVHALADGERFAWCDLGGKAGPSNQFDVYARAISAEKTAFPENGLKLPVQLKVGLNRLLLKKTDPGARLRIGNDVLRPNDGAFDVVVRDRGPLDMRLTDAEGDVVATYHADVRRPFLIDAAERYLPADAKEFDLDVALDVAGDQAADLLVICRRDDGAPEKHKASLTSGHHRLMLPVPAGDGPEVRVQAKASISLPTRAKPYTLDALHWFAVGVGPEDVNVYREGIRTLPTDRLCWAILADAVPGLLLSQQGNGQYGTRRSQRWSRLWPQMCVYVPALLYKTDHPDNSFFGDKRLLDSAILGMEYALRPEIRIEEYGYPDSRSPQAFLLTYDLLQGDIEPERRAYWAGELEHVVEGQVGRFLRRIVDKYTFYSIDCETSTNHMSYHVADVYLAGILFEREDWKELGTILMHRLARHGRDGYFEEQRGSPVNHYTWLTANALGEYYYWSGDASVLPTLRACARYMTAITTAQGQTMALHDSRNSHHRPFACGEYVLSHTPEGRRAARAVITGRMGNSPAYMRGEGIFRIAEDAVYFLPGEDADVFGSDSEHPFPYGILVRKDGFQYGLSTIARGAVSGNYIVDAQNVIEMFHKDAGCILHGGGSQTQPEAGNFWRKLDEPDWEGKTVGTSNDYLPHAAMLAAIPGGHELGLAYRTFEGSIVVRVLSPGQARLEAFAGSDKGPVTFSFFPGVDEDEQIVLDPDGRTLRFRQVTFHANMPFRMKKGFRMLNPYSMQYQYAHKPVRCWLELDSGERFILDIAVAVE